MLTSEHLFCQCTAYLFWIYHAFVSKGRLFPVIIKIDKLCNIIEEEEGRGEGLAVRKGRRRQIKIISN